MIIRQSSVSFRYLHIKITWHKGAILFSAISVVLSNSACMNRSRLKADLPFYSMCNVWMQCLKHNLTSV